MICLWSDIDNQNIFLPQLENIFFSSSSIKNFSSVERKKSFYYKYLGYYIEKYPQYFWVDFVDKTLRGYLACSPDSSNDIFLRKELKSFELFEQYFKIYPAHFHMNTDINFRSLGIGESLFKCVANQLKKMGCVGGHITTDPMQRNRFFYHKLGFHFQDVKELGEHSILFMGIDLRKEVDSNLP